MIIVIANTLSGRAQINQLDSLNRKTGTWITYFYDSLHDYSFRDFDKMKPLFYFERNHFKNIKKGFIESAKVVKNYKQGKLEGVFKVYLNDTFLIVSGNYKNNLLNGHYQTFEYYDLNIFCNHSDVYKNGKLNGPSVFLSQYGSPRIGAYSNGKLYGTQYFYNTDGDLSYVEKYKNCEIVYKIRYQFDKYDNLSIRRYRKDGSLKGMKLYRNSRMYEIWYCYIAMVPTNWERFFDLNRIKILFNRKNIYKMYNKKVYIRLKEKNHTGKILQLRPDDSPLSEVSNFAF